MASCMALSMMITRSACGKKTLEELGDELFTEIKQVADGKLTKAEALGYTEMAIARVCNYM